jgi:hypothetical protein
MDQNCKKVFLTSFQRLVELEMSVSGGHHRDLLRGSVKVFSWIVEKGLLPAAVIYAGFVSGKKPVK